MNLSERLSRISLRLRILIPFLVVSLGVSFAATYVLGRSLESQVYEQADQEVRQEALLTASYLEREQTYIVSQLTLAVEEGRMLTGENASLVDMMSQLDLGSIMSMLGFGGESLVKADLVKIVDQDGKAVLNLNRDLVMGRDLDDGALIARGLQGASTGGIVTTIDGKSAYLVGAAPFGDSGAYSLIMFGTKIDREMLSSTGLAERILFAYTNGGIAACSTASHKSENWAQALAVRENTRPLVGGDRYVMASAPVTVNDEQSPLSVAVVMPVDTLAAEAAGYWTRTWLIFAAGAATLLLAGFIVARRVADPIRQMTRATGRLKKGDFGTRINVTRDDEIGELARAFNTMGEELKARDESLAESFNEVKRLSETDALTGLLNHRMINERLAQELARAQRYGGRFGLIVIDLDNFKLLNDTHGHPVGDETLRRFGELLVREMREVDFIGRHGGDEFMIVLPECGPPEIAGAAEKLQSVLADSPLETPDGSLIPLQMSLGVACYPEDGQDVNTLIALADANLYLSKSRGGNTVTGTQMTDLSPEDITVYGMLGSLVTIVDNKDRYTRHHSEEVTEWALSLGKVLGLSDESQKVLRVAGLLHDIGKIGVPDRILRKPGRLTEEEYEAIKQHPLLGDAIVAAIPDLSEVRAAVVAHHERYDGKGYPHQLSGEDIPLLGRILAVTDAYSAMITDRPYRKALSVQEAVAELEAGRGGQFDPRCVDAFIQALDSFDEAVTTEGFDDAF